MKLPFNWFDLVLLAVLVGGVLRGRKRGMSEELLPLLMWLTLLFSCAFLYELVSKLFGTQFSTLTNELLAYIAVWILGLSVFAVVRRIFGGKLLGSDIFGKSEYYLGMGAGFVRYFCALLMFLALLNARLFTPAEVASEEKYQNEVYGSTYFPGLHTLQSGVFEQSLTGPLLKTNLSFLLIKPTPQEVKVFKQREFQMPN